MGIDHGLGGRDGVKSKQRREKKAKKNKVVAMRAITGGKKKEVIFDEKARTEWLSGFHKRKQERRKYGLAMEVLKKNKAHKEMVREQRNVFNEDREKRVKKASTSNAGNEEDEAAEEDASEDEEEEGDADSGDDAAMKFTASVASGKNQEVSVFEDPSTLSMFGSTVSVVVDTSIGEEEDSEDDGPSVDRRNGSQGRPVKKGKPAKVEPTRLEKALKLAKAKMGQRKKKHRDNSIQGKASSIKLKSKVEGSKLLSKVLQKPMRGKQSGGRRRK